MRKIALHEAGHLVVCEALRPGSVGLASIRSSNGEASDGFIHRCRDLPRETDYVLVSLAGKAAVELFYADACADGCMGDIHRAFRIIRDGIWEKAASGFGLVYDSSNKLSENMLSRIEAVTHAELERYLLKTRDILLRNMDFLVEATEALMEKGTLLYSDIRAIRDSVAITEVAV